MVFLMVGIGLEGPNEHGIRGSTVVFCSLQRMVKLCGFSPCVSCSLNIMGIGLVVVINIESLWCL